MTNNPANVLTATDQASPGSRLRVGLLTKDGVPLLGTEEPVSPPDLLDIITESYRDDWLAKGRLVALHDLEWRLTVRDQSPVQFFEIELRQRSHSASATRRRFSHLSLVHVARRAVKRFDHPAELDVSYQVHMDSNGDGSSAFQPIHGTPPSFPTRVFKIPLPPEIDPQAGAFPVLYERRALEQAEAFCRRGASAPEGPVESGGVLLGILAVCTSTQRFYCRLIDILEVGDDAVKKEKSLLYGTRTWTRITAIVQARRSQGVLLLGQAHGHNFLPAGNQICPQCPRQSACAATSSSFLSPADLMFHASLFLKAPYAVAHTFGLTPRNEPVDTLFALRAGRLQPTTYHVIEEPLDLNQWPSVTLGETSKQL